MKIKHLYVCGVAIGCLLLVPFPVCVQASEPVQLTSIAHPTGAVNAAQGQDLLNELKQTLFVLDVRTEDEFNAGHIPTATLMPLHKLAESTATLPNDRPILIVCRTGRRAAEGYALLRKARPDITNVWYLKATPVYGENGAYSFK